MSDVRDMSLAINKQDLLDAAIVLGGMFQTFSARDYAELLRIQAHGMEEEQANELLLEFVGDGKLREVGPGVYALPFPGKPANAVNLEEPLWPEDARRDH